MNIEPSDSRSAASASKSSPAILLIDDDPQFRGAMSHLLEKLEFPTVAVGPMEGLAAARRERPRLILLDLCLDGYDSKDTRSSEHLLKTLKDDPTTREIPVIVISGQYCDPETEARFELLGAKAFFPKAEVFDIGGAFLRNVRARLLISEAEDGKGCPSPAVEVQEAGETQEDSSSGFPCELTVLVIDDEEDTAERLALLFKDRNCRVLWAPDGRQGLRQAATELPDLVILDLHLPGLDGKELCRRLRERDQALYLPILMLTSDERAKAECLRIGADGYVLKIEPNDVLLASVLGMLRRRRFGMKDDSGVVRVGGVEIDAQRRVTVSGRRKPEPLTKTEAGIVLLLMSACGKTVANQTLYEKYARDGFKRHSSAIRTHVSNIKAKLGRHAGLIQAVGQEQGYRFNVELANSLA